jgi:hypothetical protein
VPERCCAYSANPITVVAVGVDPYDGVAPRMVVGRRVVLAETIDELFAFVEREYDWR